MLLGPLSLQASNGSHALADPASAGRAPAHGFAPLYLSLGNSFSLSTIRQSSASDDAFIFRIMLLR